MAQAVHCDWEGDQDTPADVLVSQLANGDTSAWCFAHYVEVCRSVVETVEATIREASAAEAEARLAGVTAPAGPDQEPSLPPGFPDELNRGPGFRPDDQPGGPEGDQPVQGSLGGPETGDPGQPAPEPTPEPTGPGGAASDAPA